MEINIAELKIGSKVCYQPKHYKDSEPPKWENGMVKEIPDHTNDWIRVVYNCGGDWNNFKDYTSALTSIKDLTLGWKHDEEYLDEPEECPLCGESFFNVQCRACGYENH